ncbi:hypothetical protein BDF19DRAFT_196893 [Syncephalis fuscata]|nr:hypothetical protein BDF19DRAFT_196893 [Syncephalis fuscata]
MVAPYEQLADFNGFDYWANFHYSSIKEIQEHTRGVHIQLIFSVFLTAAVFKNICHITPLLIQYPYKLAGWYCMIVMLMEFISTGGIIILHHLPRGLSCKVVIWSALILVLVANFALNMVVLERAYLACQRNQKVLIAGLILNAAPVIAHTTVAIITRNYSFNAEYGCHTRQRAFMYYMRIIFDLPLNILFSLAFIIAIHHYVQKSGARS